MKDFPHNYSVSAAVSGGAEVRMSGEGLPDLALAPPAEFDGPGDRWSPEMLQVAAIAGCFIMTFRAIATASKFPWTALECDVEGVMEKVDRQGQFTGFRIDGVLKLPADAREDRARRMLEMAERNCLITNSVKAPVEHGVRIETG